MMPHITILADGQRVQDVFTFEPCHGCDNGCTKFCPAVKRYHCPICPVTKFKPKQRLQCIQHVVSHFFGRNGNVRAYGYRITGCPDHSCGGYKASDGDRTHFHCPNCDKTHARKNDFIDHIQACLSSVGDKNITDSSDNRALVTDTGTSTPVTVVTDTGTSTPVTVTEESTPITVTEEVTPITVTEEATPITVTEEATPTIVTEKSTPMMVTDKSTYPHITILADDQRVQDVFTFEPCHGCDAGCTTEVKSYHCPICPVTKFKPAGRFKCIQHVVSHFFGHKGNVRAYGYRITGCPDHSCRGYKASDRGRTHFHCPNCNKTYSRKNEFIHHIQACLSSVGDKNIHVTDGSDNRALVTDTGTSTPVTVKEESTPITVTEEATPITVTDTTPITVTEKSTAMMVTDKSTYPHITILADDQRVQEVFTFEPCHGCDAGCTTAVKSYHCPICPVTKFRPARRSKCIQHVESHFFGCKGHVRAYGYRITGCPEPLCGGYKESGRIHFHCPNCNKTHTKKILFIDHIQACLSSFDDTNITDSSDNHALITDTGTSTPITVKEESTPITVTEEATPITVTEESTPITVTEATSITVTDKFTYPHITILADDQRVQDVFTFEPCHGCDAGCTTGLKKYHCPICPVTKFKPAVRSKCIRHVVSHFFGNRGHVRAYGYRITGCPDHSCGGYKASGKCKTHFHCPNCNKTQVRKDNFIDHIQACLSSVGDKNITDSSDNHALITDTGTSTPITVTEESTPITVTEEATSITVTEATSITVTEATPTIVTEKSTPMMVTDKSTYPHITILADGQRVRDVFTFEPCHGCDAGCTTAVKRYHCPICPVMKFKPARRPRCIQHVESHFFGSKGHVRACGYRITGCPELLCGGYKESGRSSRHFHCPNCNKTHTKKKLFIDHIQACLSSFDDTNITDSSDNQAFLTDAGISTPVTDTEESTPITVTEEATPITVIEVGTPITVTDNTPITVTEKSTPMMVTDKATPMMVTDRATPMMVADKSTPVAVTESSASVLKTVISSAVTDTDISSPVTDTDFTCISALVMDTDIFTPVTVTVSSAPIIDNGTTDNVVKKLISTSRANSGTRECGLCHKFYHKKYIRNHERLMHQARPLPTINSKRHHHAVCIDAENGIYAVSRNRHGIQYPIHVKCARGRDLAEDCEVAKCHEMFQLNLDSGFMCDHVASTHFSVPGLPCTLLSDELSKMVIDGFMSTSLKDTCLELFIKADSKPILVSLPHLHRASDRYNFFSVFTGTSQLWCKMERVLVTIDTKSKHLPQLLCRCRRKGCVHLGIVRWWLYQNGDRSHPQQLEEEDNDNLDDETDNIEFEEVVLLESPLCQSSDAELERTVNYLTEHKKITNIAELPEYSPEECPTELVPSETHCLYCNTELGAPRIIYDRASVVSFRCTKDVTYQTFAKLCPNCNLRFRYQETKDGIFNFNDHLLVSYQVLVHIRSGLSTDSAISRMVSDIELTMNTSLNHQNLEHAYMTFEAMVHHDYGFFCFRCSDDPKVLVHDLTKKAVFRYADNHFLPDLSIMSEEIATIHEESGAEIKALKEQLQSTQTELDFLSKKLINTEQLYETATKQIEEFKPTQSELIISHERYKTATKQVEELKLRLTDFDVISKKLANTEQLYETATKQIEELKSSQSEYDNISKKLANTEQLYETAIKRIEELLSTQTHPADVTSIKVENPEQLCDIAKKRVEELKLKQTEPDNVILNKLKDAEALNEIATKRIEELLGLNEKLHEELRVYKVKASDHVDRAVQVDRAEFSSRKAAVCISEPVVGEASSSSEQVIVSPWADVKRGEKSGDGAPTKSIAESLKETAEAAVQQSGFVFDDSTGLYYDYGTGYYYNHEHSLYFDPKSGTYFYYDSATGESQFHSKVDVAPQQQPPAPFQSQYYPPQVITPSYPPPALPSYHTPPQQQQIMRPPYRGPPAMPYGVIPSAADHFPRNDVGTGDWYSDRRGRSRSYYETEDYRGDGYKHEKHYRSSEQRSRHHCDSRDRDLDYSKSSKSKRSYHRSEAERDSYDAHRYRKRKYREEHDSERKTSRDSHERDHDKHHRKSTHEKKSRDWTSAERTTQELQQRLRRERRKKKEDKRRKEKAVDGGEESETNEGQDGEFMLVDETVEENEEKDRHHAPNGKMKGDDGEDEENSYGDPYKEMYEAAQREFTSDLKHSSKSASEGHARPVSPNFPSSSSSSASVSSESDSDVERERKISRSVIEEPQEGPEIVSEYVEPALIARNESDATLWPPCIRLIVQKSPSLTLGSLFVITCQGGTIGREGKSTGSHAIPIPDDDISEFHAEISYSKDGGVYEIQDKGSENGSYLNGVRLSEANTPCDPHVLGPGDVLRFADETELLLHIHPGTETCDGCEPGVVMAKLQQAQAKELVILSNADKQKIMRKQMKNIKRKYGLQNMNYENNTAAIHRNPGYKDKASERRKKIGSDNPYEKKAAPASVHRPISGENKGHQMLAKMGWKSGESLGSQNTGIIDPVTVHMRSKQSAGLGSALGVERSLDNAAQVESDQRWIKAQQRMQEIEKSEAMALAASTGQPLVEEVPAIAEVASVKHESSFVVGGVLDSENKDAT